MDDISINPVDKPKSVFTECSTYKRQAATCVPKFVAGLTTFLTMIYIVFVNPQILGKAGMDNGAVFVASPTRWRS